MPFVAHPLDVRRALLFRLRVVALELRRRDLDNLSIALDVEISTDHAVYANFTEIEQVALNFVITALYFQIVPQKGQ